MLTPLQDLIKLSQRAGRIPGDVPGHYVRWAQNDHRRRKGRPLSRTGFYIPDVIYLRSATL